MRSLRPGLFLLLLPGLLGGCTTARQAAGMEDCDEPGMTSPERQICKSDTKYTQTVVGGTLMGIGGGAALGALSCAIAGKNPLLCAGIGAVAGGVLGGAAGAGIADRQQASTQRVAATDSVTDQIRKQNEDLQSQVVAARQVVASGQQKLANLNAAVRAGTMTAEQANAERARVARDSQHLGSLVQHLQEQQQQYVQAGEGVHSSDYSRELQEMQRSITVLQQQKDALDRAITAG